MSVLICARGNCPNIMCKRYSYEYGYLCNDCFEELVGRGVDTDVREFMRSVKPLYRDEEHSREMFDELFPIEYP